jgi:BirA family biotin operon repressor/biotin-[acetyl-CoA-carboxylase] ligase
MKTKEKLKKLFEENKGCFISGEDIGKKLGCTRCAVWKAVKSLRAEGYDIPAVQNKGYCLAENNDIITEEKIRKHLDTEKVKEINVFRSIDSTNSGLKTLAANGAPEGTLVISENQTAGRGRRGRSFFSPDNTGIYMSLLLRPDIPVTDAVKITTSAAAAAAEAIEELTGIPSKIKWVNDIYLRRRKVCGILTEAATDIECGRAEYVILGIGINVYPPSEDFPDEIKNTAGCVFEERISDMRSMLAARVISYFFRYYEELEKNTFFESYKKRIMWIGEKINIISPSGTVPAFLTGINDDCGLLVKYADGTEGVVTSGEISIRKKL